MRVRHPDITAERGTRRPARSWRCLLLVLLVLLPVTLILAAPAPVHLMAADAAAYEPRMQGQGPSDSPVCDHAGHHSIAPVAISDNRESELPAPADTVAAIPSQGPGHNRLTVAEELPHTVSSDDPRLTLPVYLLTLRIRV